MRFLLGALREYNSGRSSDGIPLNDFLLSRGFLAVANDMRVLLGPYWPIEIVDSIGPWFKIIYTADAAQASGAFGLSVKVSDLLRWQATETGDTERGQYLSDLAVRFDEKTEPRPTIEDPEPARRQLCAEYLALVRLMAADVSAWSGSSLSLVDFCARKAMQNVEWGTGLMPPNIPFPFDFLPPDRKRDKDGYGGIIMTPHWILRNALLRADYLTDQERDEIEIALSFYPDPTLRLEIVTEEHGPVEFDLQVMREMLPGDFECLVGSAGLDHIAVQGRFSADPDELPFQVYRSRTIRDEDNLPTYYVVSDHVIYHC